MPKRKADGPGCSRVIGRLVFDDRRDGAFEYGDVVENAKPLHNVHVKLFMAGQTGSLATGETDMNGEFEILYDNHGKWPLDLRLRIYERHIHYKPDGSKEYEYKEALMRKGYLPWVRNIREMIFDFGTLPVGFWPLRPASVSFTPRAVDDPMPQRAPVTQRWLGITYLLTSMYRFMVAPVVQPWMVPKSLSEKKRAEGDCTMDSDGAIVAMALNGFHPCTFQKERKRPEDAPAERRGRGARGSGKKKAKDADDDEPEAAEEDEDDQFYYTIPFSWEGLGLDDVHVVHDTVAYFERRQKEGAKAGRKELHLVKIDVRKRKDTFSRSSTAQYDEWKTYSPCTSNNEEEDLLWRRVKRIWRVNYFAVGQVIAHLTQTHLNVEQYLVAVMRNVRKNPVYDLLSPHFAGTVEVNDHADDLLLASDGSGIVVDGTPLTPQSMADFANKEFQRLNWHGWSPRDPIVEEHHFAHAQQIFWEVLKEYVTYFIERNKEQIAEHWGEIVLLNDEMVYSSVKYDDTVNTMQWRCDNEINLASKNSPRGKNRDGEVAAVSPLLPQELHDEKDPKKRMALPAEGRLRDECLANLKQFCMYVILFATFRHGYINDKQFEYSSDPMLCSLGLRVDLLDPKADETKAVTLKELIGTSLMTYTLTRIHYGYILRDETRDMNPRLRDILRSRQKDMLEHGVDVEDIRSVLNI